MPPFLVYEGRGASTRVQVRAAVAAARADGWLVIRGWAAPLAGDRLICTGTIATADHARRALFAAISGAGLIVLAPASRDTVDRFVDDLRRLGPVQHLTEERATRPPKAASGSPRC